MVDLNHVNAFIGHYRRERANLLSIRVRPLQHALPLRARFSHRPRDHSIGVFGSALPWLGAGSGLLLELELELTRELSVALATLAQSQAILLSTAPGASRGGDSPPSLQALRPGLPVLRRTRRVTTA
jgi:hypothetical protein